jgi:hypothetical protein
MLKNTFPNWLLIGILVGIIPAVIFALWAQTPTFGFVVSFCLGSLGVPFTLIGAYIGKRTNKTALFGAVIGLMIGVGLVVGILSTCFFCQ